MSGADKTAQTLNNVERMGQIDIVLDNMRDCKHVQVFLQDTWSHRDIGGLHSVPPEVVVEALTEYRRRMASEIEGTKFANVYPVPFARMCGEVKHETYVWVITGYKPSKSHSREVFEVYANEDDAKERIREFEERESRDGVAWLYDCEQYVVKKREADQDTLDSQFEAHLATIRREGGLINKEQVVRIGANVQRVEALDEILNNVADCAQVAMTLREGGLGYRLGNVDNLASGVVYEILLRHRNQLAAELRELGYDGDESRDFVKLNNQKEEAKNA